MESLSDHQLRALSKFYGTSPERLRAGLEGEELFASRPELSVSAMRELSRNGELAENYPNFANLIPNLSDGEINRGRENGYSLQLLRVEEWPDPGARLRQLRQLLANEDEFRTRYPAAYKVLQGDMAGASKTSSLYLPSFGVRLARYASWSYSAHPGGLWPGSPADACSLLIPRDRPEDPTVDQTFYRALCLHRMGWELENIALDTGMTPYRSSRSAPGKGTRDWKRRTLRKIAKGKELEDERYPRAAAIFASSHNASVRRKAKLAYSTYEKELGTGTKAAFA